MDTVSAATDRRQPPLWVALITRLHFYVGLFVGPFLLVAALSGIAYALTPQLENWLYHDALTTQSEGEAQPLARQIAAAQVAAGISTSPAAVRPAPAPGATTRVMFAGEGLGPSEHRALFIDPVTLAVRGDMTVYGTSGVLPLRTAIDQFHRSLLLGDTGRLYSELAASWLWIAALGGGFLWWRRRRTRRQAAGAQRLRQRHATLGAVALIGLLFFSATGLTWSQWAGGNIAQLRHAWGWGTPSVSTDLAAPAPTAEGSAGAAPGDPHAAHHAAASHTGMAASRPASSPADFDLALAAARAAGIDADSLEIVPPNSPMTAWKIREIGRGWPTQVDQIALDPQTFTVTDRADFATSPLAAKLTRWGIDLHMGVLFGLPNQLALVAFASCLVTLICWGYAMWWRRRTAASREPQTLTAIFRLMDRRSRLVVLLVAAAFGYALPVMGASLLLFVAVDYLRWRAGARQQVAQTA
ncbi:MAG: PepSY domain-containing protein [Salinicola sp.]|uniref:PepSY-associated TM helix domain-containing protein n=1 Tax=Salinicola sp. TaxID=1978524 RepID=UPI001D261AD1|nr:PepSY-associated TM helix domain-containing protein [Salinicola sp.]NRB57788.1 PepSY domain-containing protein [Salinicola sp.]